MFKQRFAGLKGSARAVRGLMGFFEQEFSPVLW